MAQEDITLESLIDSLREGQSCRAQLGPCKGPESLGVVVVHLEMQVESRGITCLAYRSNHLTFVHQCALVYDIGIHVRVERKERRGLRRILRIWHVGVTNEHVLSKSAVLAARVYHDTVHHRRHGRALWSSDIDTGMATLAATGGVGSGEVDGVQAIAHDIVLGNLIDRHVARQRNQYIFGSLSECVVTLITTILCPFHGIRNKGDGRGRTAIGNQAIICHAPYRVPEQEPSMLTHHVSTHKGEKRHDGNPERHRLTQIMCCGWTAAHGKMTCLKAGTAFLQSSRHVSVC